MGASSTSKLEPTAYTDILAAGGSFTVNGYNHSINSGFGNPLGGRQGWSGTSPGFVTTMVNLPATAQGPNRSISLAMPGTDNSNGRRAGA